MSQEKSARLRGNLSKLEESVAVLVATASESDELVVSQSKNGMVNLAVREPNGDEPRFLHSQYDPAREGERMAAALPDGDAVVVFGLGCAHHLPPIVERASMTIVVEPDPSMVRSAAGIANLTVLGEASVTLVTGDVSGLAERSGRRLAERLATVLRNRYLPLLHGDISVVDLAGRVASSPALFARLRAVVAETVDSIANDLAVQARFGRRWLRNTLVNLRELTPLALPDLSGRAVTIVAAGPSLDRQIDTVRELSRSGIVLATDTAWPRLIAESVNVDMVVSIDCQLASYHHVLGVESPACLVSDLAAQPVVARAGDPTIPVASAHPLHQLIRLLCSALPRLDSGAGTVTYAAADLAIRTGSSSLVFAGADFSYPAGRIYARGTYLYRYFDSIASRFCTSETQVSRFLSTRPGVTRDPEQPGRYLQESLGRYRAELQGLLNRSPVRFSSLEGDGLALVDSTSQSPQSAGVGATQRRGDGEHRADEHSAIEPVELSGDDLESWRRLPEKLERLFLGIEIGSDRDLPLSALHNRSEAEQLAAASLLPYAAYLRGAGAPGTMRELLEEAREASLALLA